MGPQCRTALHDTRAALMQDYKLSPNIVVKCSDAIQYKCKNELERNGQTLHCLMKMMRKGNRDEEKRKYQACREEVRTSDSTRAAGKR